MRARMRARGGGQTRQRPRLGVLLRVPYAVFLVPLALYVGIRSATKVLEHPVHCT